jgi:general secretion pathway protein G
MSHTHTASAGAGDQKKTNGFTLIELLVVIAIIGLLSVLAVVALGSARQKARDSRRLSDLKQMQSALELFYTEKNEYPVVADPATLGQGNYSCLNVDGFGSSGCANAFTAQVPTDPGTGVYQYISADGTTYTIQTMLEGDIGGLSGGPVGASPSGIANQ